VGRVFALPILAGLIAIAPLASAEDATDPVDDDAAGICTSMRPLATLAAIFPGAVVHGTGHFILGQRDTGLRLFAMQGIGVGLIALGAIPIAVTNASRHLIVPSLVSAFIGVGIAGPALGSDITGSAIPLEARGEPRRHLPIAEGELGYRYVGDAQFSYAHFVVTALDLRLGALRLSPSGWFALDDDNARLRMAAAVRPYGAGAWPAGPSRDGSFVDFEIALTHHRYTSDRFDVLTPEISALVRLDMARIDPLLRGLFGELGLGVGLQRFRFHEADVADTETLLLGRIGMGVFLGQGGAPYGEVTGYYDQRHDDFAGGLTGFALGIPGHFGLDGRIYLSDQVGLRAQAEIGAAFVGGMSLLVRGGEP
jgi:hypothetical protein